MNYLPLKGYEGLYEISPTGVIRSVDREVEGKDGAIYPFKGKQKALRKNKATGYLITQLYKGNQYKTIAVHRAVALTFIGDIPEGMQVNHRDGNKLNNSVENLEIVSHQENAQHAVDIGLKKYTNRLTYDEFVECLQAVIAGESYASLSERVPYKVPFLSTKLRRIAKELGLEEALDDSLKLQKQRRGRINGSRNK